MSDSDLVVGSIKKNRRDSIVFQWREFEGARFLDIRLFRVGDDGEARATKAGVTVRPGYLREFQKLVMSAEHVARVNGILAPDQTA